MRITSLLAPTLREDPSEAEIASHRLMLRAGLMRKVAAGIYTFLPLGHRAVAKVERIVREEMDKKGAQELRLPIVQPAELWEETGRWAAYGDEMWRVKDRHGRLFCLGPTHEEIITDLVRREVSSYRQLPLLLYQIQNKYRDEIRPRFGVMRAREFVMKDAYSFHRDEESLRRTYEDMHDAYTRIFSRCGLDFRAVEADTGAIGGHFSHEFMALADTGEASLVHCDACGYAANVERAEAPPPAPAAGEPAPLRRVATPGVRTIEELTAFLGLPPQRMAKILFYWARDGSPGGSAADSAGDRGGNGGAPAAGGKVGAEAEWRLVAALVRGDRQLNEVKLRNALGARAVHLASAEEVGRVAGVPTGFAGPVGLRDVLLLADPEVMASPNLVTGANEEGFHLVNVNPGRDFHPDRVVDLRAAEGGDPCPRCGRGILAARRGIEVGQIFQLGTKYSRAMGAAFLDEEGRERLMIMGCYGVGVTRTVAAVIEQHHDGDGIAWPVGVAPYHALVVPVNWAEAAQREAAERIYGELMAAGVEVCLDDRDERGGVKFKDADLWGFPLRVTVGPRALAEGRVEVHRRRARVTETVPVEAAAGRVREILEEVGRGERG